MTCVFCQIVSGDLPSAVVFDDDLTLAVMDARQPSWPNGAHVLVMPREHVETVDRLSEPTGAAIMATVVAVSRAMRQILKQEGLSVWQSNGIAAGQEVPHVHVHLLTRALGDRLLQIYGSPPSTPPVDELGPLASRLRRFGVVGEEC